MPYRPRWRVADERRPWRVRRPGRPTADRAGARLAAARAARVDLVGDLLPTGNSFVVLELNGAVDFGPVYAPRSDVFGDAVVRSSETRRASPGWPRPSASPTASSQLRS